MNEKWEYGSIELCQFVAESGVKLIKEANLELDQYEWCLSEEYLHTPERIRNGIDKVGFHIMIQNGKVSGGASLPDECLSLPGLHMTLEWPLVAHSASFSYDGKGNKQARADMKTLFEDLSAVGKGSKVSLLKGKPLIPPAIGGAIAPLHNISAKRVLHSPEVKDLPQTTYGVPILTKMTEVEKIRFYKLLGR